VARKGEGDVLAQRAAALLELAELLEGLPEVLVVLHVGVLLVVGQQLVPAGRQLAVQHLVRVLAQLAAAQVQAGVVGHQLAQPLLAAQVLYMSPVVALLVEVDVRELVRQRHGHAHAGRVAVQVDVDGRGPGRS
jgi:hypothetical protein